MLHGTVKVGFQPEELIELTSSSRKPETRKLSRRDLSTICGQVLATCSFSGLRNLDCTLTLSRVLLDESSTAVLLLLEL